jgi:MFS family permease
MKMERWKSNLYFLWIAQILSLMSFGFGIPFIPYFIQELGVTDPVSVKFYLGILNSVPGLAMGIMAPVWGYLADRLGRKMILLRATFFGILVLAGMGLSQNVNHLIIARLMQGIFTGTVTASYALVAAGTPDNKLSYALGVIASSNFIGSSIGPFVGGLMAEQFGYRISFFAGSSLLVLSFLIILIAVKEENKPKWSDFKEQSKDKKENSPVIHRLRNAITPLFFVILVILFFVKLGGNASAPYISIFVQEIRGTITGSSAEVENRSSKMASLITRTVRRGGNVIIPAFSVGRTQEMIYDINKNNAESEYFRAIINNTKTFIDSPLAINATSIFMENSDCYDEEAIAYLESGDDPLQFPGLTFTLSPEESKNINSYNKPCIIIAASGMCDAGRIKHHLKHNLWRHESTVIFVGYQAQGTLGRRILDGNKKVKIFGEVIDVNANIEKIDGFSAHADQKELLNWAAAFKRKPRKIFLVHGEPEVQEEFSKLIQNRLGIETLIPDRGDSFDLTKDQSVYMGVTQENRNINNDFKRLHLLDYLYDADEEISSVIQEVYDLLKTDISDIDVEKLLKKSKEIEQSIKAFKDTFSMYK